MTMLITTLMEIGDRPNQEDAVNVNGRILQEEHHLSYHREYTPPALFALCDGMGGHAFGERASLWTAKQAYRLLEASSAEEAREIIYLIQKESERELPPDTGTTLVFCLVRDNRIIAGNAGDSRIYGIKGENIFTISHDHSIVQELIDAGEITPEEARRHPLKNLITLGIGPAFEREWSGPGKAFVAELEELPDYLLLCSDGLSDNLSDEEILEEVLIFEREAPKELFLRAREKTTYLDNVSIILAKLR